MNIEDVRAFVAVVDTGSVGKAALRLHLTQPAVSRRVQRLEDTLGITLLDRDSKPCRPTRVGEAAYRRCVAVLRASEALASEARAETLAVPLRIGLSYAISESVFAPAIEALRASWPGIAIHVVAERSVDLRKQVAEGALDAAVIALHEDRVIDEPGTRRLGSERVVVAAAREAGLPPRAMLADLAGRPWVINPIGCGFRAQLERALAGLGHPVEVIAETWGMGLQLALVARNLGLGLVPERLIAESPYRDALQATTIEGFEASLAIWFVRSRAEGPFGPSLDALSAAVTDVLGRK